MVKLNLDWDQVALCRELAEAIVHPIERYIAMHTTVAVERAVLRLFGFEGDIEVEKGHSHPVANLIIDKIPKESLRDGVASVIAAIKKNNPKANQPKVAELILKGEIDFAKLEILPADKSTAILKPWLDSAIRHLDRMRYKKEEMRDLGESPKPLKYVMLGTGRVQEDVEQARVSAKQGADVIAIVRSTAQSLLDYVPSGETSEGYGGTFATQENFRILKEALDELSHDEKRFIRFAHNSSGLCMPELSVMAAFEGVDYLLNDVLYGTLYRDINIKRSIIDQNFSKIITGRAGIVIHTGEEIPVLSGKSQNAHQNVLANHFINEQFAKSVGMRDDLIGIGHAFEMDPKDQDSLLQELAMAQLMREIFFRSPIKYFPSSRYKKGDVYFNQVIDTLFHMVALMTGQHIQLLGTPAGHFSGSQMQDRFEALKAAQSVFKAGRSLYNEIEFVTNGKVMRHARTVLDMTAKYLRRIKNRGFFEAVEEGLFADLPRSKDGGRGCEGVIGKSRRYANPFIVTPTSNGR